MTVLRFAAGMALLAVVGGCNPPPEPASAPADAAPAPAAAAAPSADCPLAPVAAAAPERQAILDAVRPRIETMTGKPVEFVVNRLETACDYARLIAEPRARAGGDRYEPIDALFVRRDGAWSLALIASTEEGSGPAADQYRAAHPDTPEALLYR